MELHEDLPAVVYPVDSQFSRLLCTVRTFASISCSPEALPVGQIAAVQSFFLLL